MDMDDELCLCFHVKKRKVVNFLRNHQPRAASQLSECFGAGTGCGWCRPYLRRLFQEVIENVETTDAEPTAEEYSTGRSSYVREGKGTPPAGATPID